MYKADVVGHFEKVKHIAEVLGITPGSISQWGKVIPEKQAMRLERITKGKLKYIASLYEKAA